LIGTYVIAKRKEWLGYKIKKKIKKIRQLYYQACIFENISCFNEDVIYFIQNLEVRNRRHLTDGKVVLS
jgi:hypothetical protein